MTRVLGGYILAVNNYVIESSIIEKDSGIYPGLKEIILIFRYNILDIYRFDILLNNYTPFLSKLMIVKIS